MNPRTRSLVIDVILVCTVGLIGGLAGCAADQPATPTATLTRAEEIAQEFITQYGVVTSMLDCRWTEDSRGYCDILEGAEQITRPEWEELLPKTEFYLVTVEHYGDTPTTSSTLIIEQDRQRYTPDTFDQLLEVNGIVVTDKNRELIAKAFALIGLHNYLAGDIVFSDWQEGGDWWADFGRKPNYSITTWAKIEGMKAQWFFWFKNEQLLYARHSGGEYHMGDYIDTPYDLPPFHNDSYFFREK